MPSEHTRRDFMKLSAIGLTAVANPKIASAFDPAGGPASDDVVVRVTSGKLRYASAPHQLGALRAQLTPTSSLSIPTGSSRKYWDSAPPSPTLPVTR